MRQEGVSSDGNRSGVKWIFHELKNCLLQGGSQSQHELPTCDILNQVAAELGFEGLGKSKLVCQKACAMSCVVVPGASTPFGEEVPVVIMIAGGPTFEGQKLDPK